MFIFISISETPFLSNLLFITLRYVITFYVSKSEIQTQIFFFGSFFHSASLLLILLNNNLCRNFCFVLCILKLHIHSVIYSFSLFSFYLYIISAGSNDTVKPVYKDHPRDPKFVAVVDRWSLTQV